MEYLPLKFMPRDQLVHLLNSNVPDVVGLALLTTAQFDPDADWATSQCLSQLRNPSIDVRAAAITGLRHIARIHRRIDLQTVLPILNRLLSDSQLGGRASDALDDIQMFARRQGGGDAE